jgi:hypothetical protein
MHVRNGLVYFLLAKDEADPAAAGVVKIGFTTSLRSRVRSLQTASAVPLRLLGTVEAGPEFERYLHRLWAHLRQKGEWFSYSPALANAIDQYVKAPTRPEPPPLSDVQRRQLEACRQGADRRQLARTLRQLGNGPRIA